MTAKTNSYLERVWDFNKQITLSLSNTRIDNRNILTYHSKILNSADNLSELAVKYNTCAASSDAKLNIVVLSKQIREEISVIKTNFYILQELISKLEGSQKKDITQLLDKYQEKMELLDVFNGKIK